MITHEGCDTQVGKVGLMHFLGVQKSKHVKTSEKRRVLVVTSAFATMCCLAGISLLAYSYHAHDNVSLPSFGGNHNTLTRTDSIRIPPSSGSSWYNLLLPQPNSSYFLTLSELIIKKRIFDSPCDSELTTTVKLEGLPESNSTGEVNFQTDIAHKLTLAAYREDGARRCSGGDYFEMDFHDRDNLVYRSRLPVVDFGNGSYGLELMVPSRFAGAFELVAYLGFSNWRGLLVLDADLNFTGRTLVLKQAIQFYVEVPKNDSDTSSLNHEHTSARFTNLKQCTESDFLRNAWHGRWTRTWFNNVCLPDHEKLFHCLPWEHYACEEPWCFGPVGKLDSNGWQYSAHCSFKIFEAQEAWDCLSGRWIYSWGDSTSQDTLRNLLLFALDLPPPFGLTYSTFTLPRLFDNVYLNPRRSDQVFQVTEHYNGARNLNEHFEGMRTLSYEEHQYILTSHFNGTRWPDTIVMNSALHDAWSQDTVEQFSNVSDFAIRWWMDFYDKIPQDKKPLLVWRLQVAPVGFTGQSFTVRGNVNRMEMFNLIFAEKLQKAREMHNFPVIIIDAFDLTFPWHYTNEYSDGAHYGQPPSGERWYYVDLMLVHIYLNAVCPSGSAAATA